VCFGLGPKHPIYTPPVQSQIGTTAQFDLTFNPHTPMINGFQRLAAVLFEILKDISASKLRIACIQAFRAPLSNYTSLAVVSKVKECKSFESLWETLADSPHWNCIDLRLLEAMAAASLKLEATQIIKNYKEAYYCKTVGEVLPGIPVVRQSYTNCTEVCDTLDLNPNKLTIYDVLKHRFFLENNILETGNLTLGYSKIVIGSVKITWQIPFQLVYQAYCCLNKNQHLLTSGCQLRVSDTPKWDKLPVLWYGERPNKIGKIRPFHTRENPYTLLTCLSGLVSIQAMWMRFIITLQSSIFTTSLPPGLLCIQILSVT